MQEPQFLHVGMNVYFCSWYFLNKLMVVYGPIPDEPTTQTMNIIGTFSGKTVQEARKAAIQFLTVES